MNYPEAPGFIFELWKSYKEPIFAIKILLCFYAIDNQVRGGDKT